MAVRKVAFVAFIASVLSLLAPGWNLMQTMSGLVSRGNFSWWQAVPWTVATWLFSAIMPAFFFALYRSGETLRIPKPMRLLSRAGAIVAFLFVASALYVEYLDADFSARGGAMNAGARLFGHVVSVLNIFSATALGLLLASFCFEAKHESTVEAPRSQLLDRATRIAVIVYGIVLTVSVISVLATPYTYSSLRSVAMQSGRTMPPFSDLLQEAIRNLANQACLFIPPYVVWKSQPITPAANEEPQRGSDVALLDER